MNNIKIEDIRIPERIRKDDGDIAALAHSISRHGLINPITLMKSNDEYVLIAGYRRLKAVELMGINQIPAIILSPMDAEEQLRLEIEENENRKDLTHSERVEYAVKLMDIEVEKARQRQRDAARLMCSPADSGRVRDIVADKVGYNSGRQLDRVLYIAKARPDMMALVDSGKKSITGAYEEIKGITRKPKARVFTPAAGYAFVVEEVENAADAFVEAIKQAALHYKQLQKQTDGRSEVLFMTIDQAHEEAQEVFANIICA